MDNDREVRFMLRHMQHPGNAAELKRFGDQYAAAQKQIDKIAMDSASARDKQAVEVHRRELGRTNERMEAEKRHVTTTVSGHTTVQRSYEKTEKAAIRMGMSILDVMRGAALSFASTNANAEKLLQTIVQIEGAVSIGRGVMGVGGQIAKFAGIKGAGVGLGLAAIPLAIAGGTLAAAQARDERTWAASAAESDFRLGASQRMQAGIAGINQQRSAFGASQGSYYASTLAGNSQSLADNSMGLSQTGEGKYRVVKDQEMERLEILKQRSQLIRESTERELSAARTLLDQERARLAETRAQKQTALERFASASPAEAARFKAIEAKLQSGQNLTQQEIEFGEGVFGRRNREAFNRSREALVNRNGLGGIFRGFADEETEALGDVNRAASFRDQVANRGAAAEKSNEKTIAAMVDAIDARFEKLLDKVRTDFITELLKRELAAGLRQAERDGLIQ